MFGPETESTNTQVEITYGGYAELESKLDMDVLFGIDTSQPDDPSQSQGDDNQ